MSDYSPEANLRFGWLALSLLGLPLAIATAMQPLVGLGTGLSIALAVILIRKPGTFLLLFVFSLGLPFQFSVAGIPANASDATIVAWLLCSPFIQRREAWFHLPAISRSIMPLIVVVAISSVLATTNTMGAFKQLIRLIEWFVIFPLVLGTLYPPAKFLAFAAVLLMLISSLVAADGIIEVLDNGNSISHMIGLPMAGLSDATGMHFTYDLTGRAASTFGGPNALAEFLVLILGVSFAHCFRAPTRWLRVSAIASFMICSAGLIATDSRGGLIGAGATILIIWSLEMPRLGWGLMIICCCGIAAVALGLTIWPGWSGSVEDLIPGDRPVAIQDRLRLWDMAVEIWGDYPLFGVGLDNFRDHAQMRHILLLEPLGTDFHAHNTYLEILADTGIAGFLGFTAFLISQIGGLFRQWSLVRGDRRSHPSTFVLAAIGCLSAFAIFAVTDDLLIGNTPLVLVLLLSLGAVSAPSAGGSA